jgi:hypothetical protein
MINKEFLKSLKPCADRYKNYLQHYADWSGSLVDFFNLKHISHSDKVWVFVRTVDEEKKRLFAADCAESVLHIFERKYLKDDRLRSAIEAARSVVDAAARATAYAAAVDAAAADAAAYAAYADAYADARNNSTVEQNKQIEFMKKQISENSKNPISEF